MTKPGRRVRVLTLIDTISAAGGAENLAVHVAARLDRDRFDSFFCASRAGDGRLADELRRSGVPLLVLGRTSPWALQSWRPLYQLLRRERIDVLHAHKFGSNLWGSIVGSAARVPAIVAHEHSWAGEAGTLRRALDRWLIAPAVGAFVAVSSADAAQMTAVEGIDPGLIRVIPNGVPAWPDGLPSLRGELGIPAAAPVVGYVGRLTPIKALDVLLDAAAGASASLPGLRVLVAGSGSDEERLRARAAELGLGETVVFLGARDDVGAVLASVDVSVICSDSEGMPLSVLEAMAAGLPVVATRVGGLPEIVEHDVTGLLVAPRDPHALGRALTELFQDPARRLRLGAAARERHHERYDLDVVVRRIEDLYLALAKAS